MVEEYRPPLQGVGHVGDLERRVHGPVDSDQVAGAVGFVDEVAKTREPLVITKRGKALAQLTPMPPEKELFGALAGSVLKEGDIVTPLDNDWEVAQ